MILLVDNSNYQDIRLFQPDPYPPRQRPEISNREQVVWIF